MNSVGDFVPFAKIGSLFEALEISLENYSVCRSILEAGISQSTLTMNTITEAKRWKYLDDLRENISMTQSLIEHSMRRRRFRNEVMRRRLADERFSKLYDRCYEKLKQVDM